MTLCKGKASYLHCRFVQFFSLLRNAGWPEFRLQTVNQQNVEEISIFKNLLSDGNFPVQIISWCFLYEETGASSLGLHVHAIGIFLF